MGIKGLTQLIADTAPRVLQEHNKQDYFGRIVAVDARYVNNKCCKVTSCGLAYS